MSPLLCAPAAISSSAGKARHVRSSNNNAVYTYSYRKASRACRDSSQYGQQPQQAGYICSYENASRGAHSTLLTQIALREQRRRTRHMKRRSSISTTHLIFLRRVGDTMGRSEALDIGHPKADRPLHRCHRTIFRETGGQAIV